MTHSHAIYPLYKAARAEGIEKHEARKIAEREYHRITSSLAKIKLHAPGPWHVAEWAGEDSLGFADRIVYVCAANGWAACAVTNDAPMSEANATAARIIECVNALDGVPDPAAYIAHLRDCEKMLKELTAP